MPYRPNRARAPDLFRRVTTSAPALVAEGATYKPDRFSPKVAAVVRNPGASDVKSPRVSALLLDAEGQIIGGGFTYPSFVPAGGQSAVEVSVRGAAEPASVRVYARSSGI